MANLNLPNVREGGDIRFRIGLEDSGVAVDWSGLEDIRVFLYADAQKQVSGEMCEVAVDEEDNTVLKCKYSGDDVQYRGINSVLVRAKYLGEIKVYDKPAVNIVARTSDATGVVEIDDPVVPVQLSVEDVDTSLLNGAIDAAIQAAADAEHAAHLIPNQVLLDCEAATQAALDAAGKAPYINETNNHWMVWSPTDNAYVDSGKESKGDTGNGIASWTVVESQEDDGNNVVTVTFTDGTHETFNVKNGKTGNGIASIVQTTESPDDAGTNVITVTMTNGQTMTFNVKNGSKGTPGVAQAAYKSVDTLPTASAQTMDKIYLTPSGTSGVYNMSYTEFDGTAYSWEDLGTTAIQLSDYATKAEVSQLEAKVTDLDNQINGYENYLPNSRIDPATDTIEERTGVNVSEYIPFTPGQDVVWKYATNSDPGSLCYLVTYTAGKVKINQFEASDASGQRTLPHTRGEFTNCAFIRCAFLDEVIGETVIENGQTQWKPQIIPSIVSRIPTVSVEGNTKTGEVLADIKINGTSNTIKAEKKDTTPVAGSNNPITSGGVKNALDAITGIPKNYTAGAYVNSSGVFEMEGVNYSDYIPFTPGQDVVWKYANSGIGQGALVTYKADKTVISNFAASDASGQRTLSHTRGEFNNCAFIRASFLDEVIGATVVTNGGTEYVPTNGVDGIIPTKVTQTQLFTDRTPWEPVSADSGYSNPTSGWGDDTYRADWSAEDKYLYYAFLEHYYDTYLGAHGGGYKVTKRGLWNDSANDGHEVFEYTFCPLNYKYTVMLSAGMNADETQGIWGLATFIRALMNEEEPMIKIMKENIRFKVIPILNASGFDQARLRYTYPNGVNPNYNFNFKDSWALHDVSTSAKGEYPDSNIETKELKRWVNEYSGIALLWLDLHNGRWESSYPNKKILDVRFSSLSTYFADFNDTDVPLIKSMYISKGTITSEDNIGGAISVRDSLDYQKHRYAQDVCGIISAMPEMHIESTGYGADGFTNNTTEGIKCYVMQIRQIIMYVVNKYIAENPTVQLSGLTEFRFREQLI